MNHVSTLFLKGVICLIGLLAIGICVIIIGVVATGNGGEGVGLYLPVVLGIVVTAIPFLYALYQGILLLGAIEKNTAFSEASVRSIRTIEYCAFTISALYAAMMPFIIRAAHSDDAPGAVLLGLMGIFAPLITGVFAAVLQRLLQNAIDLKSENDLTV